MPACNVDSTIHACIKSILQQDFKNFELIVIDDDEHHRSTKAIHSWLQQDSRIKVFPNIGQGIVDALNYGIMQASAELIARMDCDDIMQPDRLSRQLALFNSESNLDLVASRVIGFCHTGLQNGYRAYLDWQNRMLNHDQICGNMYVESTIAHPSVVFRREKVLQLGGYRNGDFPEDYDLWLRMMQNGARFAKLPQYLLFWRDSELRSSRTDERYRREKFDRLRVAYLSKDCRLPKDRPIWFWGAGRRTRQRASYLIQLGIKPSAWIDVDTNKIGKYYSGYPVYSPANLTATVDESKNFSDKNNVKKYRTELLLEQSNDNSPANPFVLVLVNNHGAKAEIESFLQTIGYRNQRDYLLYGW